ncbi:MAG: DUF4352 domain-containing protein [Lachnospiraceae bacterium]
MKKNRKKWSCLLVILSALFCTGCGDQLLEMTEEEEKIIVNYSARTVAKYNNLQGEGLTYVADDQIDSGKSTEIEDETEQPQESTPKEETTLEEKPSTEGQSSETDQTEQTQKEQVTFQQALGLGEVAATYKGYDIASSYTEGDYYAVNAVQGKSFLIMHIDLTNQAAEAMNCNLLDAGPVFTVNVNDGTKVQAETTILLDDLSTFSADLNVGQTVSTVLLFQLPEETANSIQNINLQVLIHGETYEIKL